MIKRNLFASPKVTIAPRTYAEMVLAAKRTVIGRSFLVTEKEVLVLAGQAIPEHSLPFYSLVDRINNGAFWFYGRKVEIK